MNSMRSIMCNMFSRWL